MAKRRRVGDQLTGGTLDVNPQYLSWYIEQKEPDSLEFISIDIPRFRLEKPGASTVIEILWIDVYARTEWHFPIDEPKIQTTHLMFMTNDTGSDFEDPAVFAGFVETYNSYAEVASMFSTYFPRMHRLDLTDGAGHGFLFAGERIVARFQTTNTTWENTCRGKIWYRWKTVNLQEWIGMVQSQIGGVQAKKI